ncbi:hypothetical protein BHE74_00012545 [Ensete ventricosum]|nr:hypothetical protein GW17_00041269 [Ensete ventricosum]RWW79188.1 hypothetical protein BHE74_00012545 [Ensete ventricosum]
MTPAADLAQQDSTWHNKIRPGIMKADLAQGSPTWTKTIVECGARQRLMQTRCSKALEPCKNVCQLSKGRQRHYRLRYVFRSDLGRGTGLIVGGATSGTPPDEAFVKDLGQEHPEMHIRGTRPTSPELAHHFFD